MAAAGGSPGGDDGQAADGAAEPAGADTEAEQPVTANRRRSLSVAGAFIGVLLGLLGFALVVQLRSNAGDAQLASERPEDLYQILSDLENRQERLRLEIANLQATKSELEAGSQSRDAALRAAAERANELGILAGTLAARGPGLVIRIFPGSGQVKAADILDMVEELRDAGAEAIQLDDTHGVSVRIIAGSYFVDRSDGTIESDGRQLSGALTMTVIGDPQTLQPAINIVGGVVAAIENHGGNVSVELPGSVTVSTTVTATTPKYAEPVK